MNDVFQTQFTAWSCDFILEMHNSLKDPQKIVEEIQHTLAEYEAVFSRFVNPSDLSRLNAGETISSSAAWNRVFDEAVSLSREIDAEYFNPHVDLASHGYDSSIETIGSVSSSFSLPARGEEKLSVFPQGILHNQKNNTFALKKGVSLDFGSFLKGYVSAEIAERYAPFCSGIVVNFGGDISVRGRDETRESFGIGIYNPITKKDHWIDLKNQSLCTSGTYKRTWKNTHETLHHIFDPQKNSSSDSDFISISFWGENASLCDAMATAGFNAPESEWENWRISHPEIQYFAIRTDGSTLSSLI